MLTVFPKRIPQQLSHDQFARAGETGGDDGGWRGRLRDQECRRCEAGRGQKGGAGAEADQGEDVGGGGGHDVSVSRGWRRVNVGVAEAEPRR